MRMLASAQNTPAAGSESQNDTPYVTTRIAETYPPISE